jgi:hypothetical protein
MSLTRVKNVTDTLTVSGATTINNALTVNPDADSSLLIKDAGTNAMYITANTGDELYIGANNEYAFRIKNDGTKDVAFDNGGRVIMPNQPSFMIKGSSGNKTLASGGSVASGMYNPTVLHNVGNHLNTSNAVFTAPFDGRYYMEWLAYTQTTGGLKNEYVATYLQFSNLGPIYGFHECGPDVCAQISGIFNMSANDTVQPYTYGHGSRTQTYIGQHSYFSGHLLG